MRRPGKIAAEVIGGGLFKKPATLLYPFEKPEMPPGFRGRLTFYEERCVFCKLCMKDCPSEAIVINKLGDKQYEAIVNLGRCLFCGQCVQSCNKDALEMTREYELASPVRAELTIKINRDKPADKSGREDACDEEDVPSGTPAAAPASEEKA